MTQKKSYSRYFIILQEDEKGYALASDKLPSGYAKLEIKNDKCKISYYVQNLKKESAPYHMILVCNKKDMKKLIKVGELNIDDHGRADVCYEYGVENVANCGINVDKVAGAAIVRFMNSNIIPVMSGFASTEIPEWKGFPLIEDELKRQENEVKNIEVETVKVEEKVEEEARNIFEEYEKKIEEVKEEVKAAEEEEKRSNEVIGVKDVFENIKVVEDKIRDNSKVEKAEVIQEEEHNSSREKMKAEIKDINEELEDSRHKNKKFKNEVCEIKVEIECKEEKEAKVENKCEKCHKHEEKCDHDKHDHHDHNDEHLKGSIGMFFTELSEGFEEITNVCGEIKRCKWHKVPVHRPEEMLHCADYNKHTVVYYPMINYYPYIKKYNHFMFGYKYDRDYKMKYLVYAIPGTKSRLEQPFGGRSGFVTWVPMNVGDEREDSFGYWLMFYDFKNSTIVIPVK